MLHALHLKRDMKTSTRAGIARLNAIRDEIATLAAKHKAEGDFFASTAGAIVGGVR